MIPPLRSMAEPARWLMVQGLSGAGDTRSREHIRPNRAGSADSAAQQLPVVTWRRPQVSRPMRTRRISRLPGSVADLHSMIAEFAGRPGRQYRSWRAEILRLPPDFPLPLRSAWTAWLPA